MSINKDVITNIVGMFVAGAESVNAVVATINGELGWNEIMRLIIAFGLGVIAWYTGKQQDGKKIPKGEQLATTSVNPISGM